jgi:hypothetical protein
MRGRIQAIVFTVGSLAIIVYALGFPAAFAATTTAHPFLAGFVKLLCLGTFGELLKYRISKGSWSLDYIIERAIVWGIFGLWFTLAFAGFAALVKGLVTMENPLWPSSIRIVPDNLWMAFSMSLWINLLGMYAWGMMVGHEWCNHLISSRWRSWSLRAFAEGADKNFVLAFIPKTLLFWIPAHTFTFAMPAAYRVFIAALLAIVLGFLLSVGRRAKPARSPSMGLGDAQDSQ